MVFSQKRKEIKKFQYRNMYRESEDRKRFSSTFFFFTNAFLIKKLLKKNL